VRDGFVASFSHPGGNVTGITFFTALLGAYRRAGLYASQILKGERPAQRPPMTLGNMRESGLDGLIHVVSLLPARHDGHFRAL
jgi:hypothetical protein